MSNKIKISVIIPVYNTSKYLSGCLDSVVNQTLKDIEIICIDDGSKDNSLEILNNYAAKDERIKVLTQKHKSQGAARNLGLKIAQGEYVGFVDSDDWIELDMYEKLYNRAKESDSEITMCAVTTYNDNNSGEYSQSNTYANLDIFPKAFFEKTFSCAETLDFFTDICVYPVNKIYKRDFIVSKKLKFIENICWDEDGVFFYESWLKADKISLIKYFGYYYRMYSDTSVCFNNDFYKLYQFKTLKYKKQILKKFGIYKKLKTSYKAHKYKTIPYWLSKIDDKIVKFLYIMLMFFNAPKCFIAPLKKLQKELRLLFNILLNKNKKIAFWGASIFLENFISKYHIKNKNIIGIIDKNPQKHNKKIGEYLCYPPEKLKELGVDMVIITIVNFSKPNQQSIKDFLNETGQEKIILDKV